MQDATSPEARVAEHAKLFTVDGRQVLAFLQRGDYDALRICLQVWVSEEDTQLRAEIVFDGSGRTDETDRTAAAVFADLNDEVLPLLMRESGMDDALREIAHG